MSATMIWSHSVLAEVMSDVLSCLRCGVQTPLHGLFRGLLKVKTQEIIVYYLITVILHLAQLKQMTTYPTGKSVFKVKFKISAKSGVRHFKISPQNIFFLFAFQKGPNAQPEHNCEPSCILVNILKSMC